MKLLATGSNPTNITTTPPALAVNTCPANAKSFELQGRSLVLNQLVQNGNFVDTNNWSTSGCSLSVSDNIATLTFPNTTTGVNAGISQTTDFNLPAGRTILLTAKVRLSNPQPFQFGIVRGSAGLWTTYVFGTNFVANTWYTVSSILQTATAGSTSTYNSIVVYSTGGAQLQAGDTFDITNFMLVDLTQTFGAGFEPTTVDQLQSIIDLSKYILFNPGTFIHNNATYEVNKWNQLVSNISIASDTRGLTITKNDDGTITVSGQPTSTGNIIIGSGSDGYIFGHKYLLCGLPKGLSSINLNRYLGGNLITDSGDGAVGTASSTGGTSDAFRINVSSTSQAYNFTFAPLFVDLTDIFGAGKEPSTVDECKLRFLSMGIDITKYQPYSPLDGQYCGYRNIWDEEWELGVWNQNTGTFSPDSSHVATRYKIAISPNTVYYARSSQSLYITFFGTDATTKVGIASVSNNTFTTPSDAYFMVFYCDSAYGTTYKNDISIYQVSNKVDLGFNIWDEEVESGYIDPNGVLQPHSTSLRSKNYCKCIAGSSYYAKQPTSFANATAIAWYKSDKTFLSRNFVNNETVTAPTDAMFFKVSLYNYGTTYNHDICINLSQPNTSTSPHNGDYRPYLMLRGIGSDFNVWDEEWESGTINSSGQNEVNGTRIRSKNYIPILPSTTYYVKCSQDTKVYYYDENKTFISTFNSAQNYSFTSIPTARYIRIVVFNTTSYGNNVCINLSQPQMTINPHNGQYVPHLFDTYDSMSGILTRRIGAVDLGAQTWSGGTNGKWRTTITPANNWVANNTKIYALAEKYEIATANDIYYDVVTVPSIGGEDADGHLYCYTGSSSIQPSGMFLYELVAYQVFTPTSKIGVVDLGSLSWTRVDVTGSGGYVFSTPATPLQMYKQSDNLWCSGYTTGHYTGTGSTIYNYGDKTIAQHTPSGEFNIYVRDDSYTSVSAFTNAVKGKILTYELSDSVSQTTITQPISFVAGKLSKQYGVVDLGSLSWTYVDVTKVFWTSYSPVKPVSNSNIDAGNIICSAYTPKPYGYIANHLSEDMMIGLNDNATNVIRIRNLSYSDATAFKNSLQGQYLIYELVDGATGMTYATAGNLIQKTKGDVGDVDFNLKYWEMKDIKLLKAGEKFLAVNQ